MSRRRKKRGAPSTNRVSPARRATAAGDRAGNVAPPPPSSSPAGVLPPPSLPSSSPAGVLPPPSSPPGGAALLWIVRAGICLVLATPLVVSQNVIYPFVVGKAVFARSVIEITFVFWAALVFFHPRRRPSRSPVIAAFAVWLLVSWISGLFGVSPTRSMWSTYERMLGVFNLAHWFAFTLMAGSVFRSAADWRLLFGVNLVVGTAVCATSLANRFGLIDVGLLSAAQDRISSTLGNPVYLGVYLLVNAILGSALFIHLLGQPGRPAARRIGSGAAKSLCAVMVLVNLWTMWLSGTRSATAGLGAVALMVAAGAAWRGTKVTRAVVGAAVAVVLSTVVLLAVTRPATLAPVVNSNVMLDRIADTGRDPSDVERIHYARAGLRAFLDRPMLGWGPENFLIAWGRYNVADTLFGDHAHNKLIEELTTKGILGLLSYLAVWTAMAFATIRPLGRLSGRDRLQLYVVAGALAAYFAQSLFQIDNQVSTMHFALLAAFAAAAGAWGRSPEPAPAADTPPPRVQLPPALERIAGKAGRRPSLARRAVELRTALERIAGLLTAPRRAPVSTAVVTALAIVSLAHFNVRLYSAASAAAAAMTPSRPWPDRLDDFASAIRGFPGLANQLRAHLANSVVEHDDLSDRDFRRTVVLVMGEAERGSRGEPQNWLHEATMATFFQLAVTRDAEYLDVARRHVARAAELAPGVPRVTATVNLQNDIEEIFSAALVDARDENAAMATSTVIVDTPDENVENRTAMATPAASGP